MTAFQTSKNDSKGGFCNQMQKTQMLISLHINYLYTFFNILREKACFLLRIFVSLHRQSKEQSSCAKSRSSMKTEAGLNRWQALVINEDHKNGQRTAFWGIVIQGTLKRRQSMINFKNFQNFKKDPSITNKW